LEFSFDKRNGTIQHITNSKGKLSLSGGPLAAGVDSEVEGVNWQTTDNGDFEMDIRYSKYPKKVVWTLKQTGLLGLEADAISESFKCFDFLRIFFKLPEEKVEGVKWMGCGPYRVWKNRMKGSNIGVWEKAYNNTVTGESFNNLVYPEFKGYHG